MNTKAESARTDLLIHKRFFLIGLSFKWNSIERLLISDAKAIKEQGGEVYLYTFRDSIIDERAKKLGIHCLYHQGIVATKLIKWNRLKSVSKLIKKHNVDFVHCYDVKLVWPLTYFLKTKPLIPLVLTLGNELQHFYRGFWYRPLNRRIDHVFTTSLVINENVWGNLGIPPIKVSTIGFPVRSLNQQDELSQKAPPFRFDESRWYLGTNLSGVEKNTKFLDVLFHVLKVLLGQEVAGKGITFVLGSERHWNECLITDDLKRRVKDWGLEDYVAFTGPCDIAQLQTHLDLWVGMKTSDSLEDYCASALTNEIPTLLPRTTASMELLRRAGSIGETYKIGDARSLREKCLSILNHYDTYKDELGKSSAALKEFYDELGYEKRLTKNYHQLIKRRLRLMRSRKKA